MSNSVKVNSRLCGFLSGGKWDKDSRKFVVGKFKAGDKFGLNLAMGVSSKKGDKRVYGQSIPVTMFLDNKEDFDKVINIIENGMVVVEGYFQANNYEKDGKEVRGNQFVCGFKDLYKADEYGNTKSVPDKPDPIDEPEDEADIPW